MNPYQILESARPDPGPMPPLARRHVRERLFEVATRSQTSVGDPNVTAPNTARANAARLAALALLGIVGVGGLAYSATRGTGATEPAPPGAASTPPTVDTEPIRVVVEQPPPPTVAPTTTMPPVAGSAETPLLLPVGRRRLDELTVTRTQLGGSTLLLRAPDLSTVGLREADGIAPPPPEPPTTDETGELVPVVPPRVVGSVEVTQPGDPGVYDIAVPCGSLELREGPGFLPYRPEIVELLSSITLVDGSIDIRLPPGWSVIDIGPSTEEFAFGLPVEVGDRDVTVRLAQYPDGNLAVAGYGEGQFAPVTFRGQPAWISRDPDEPTDVEVIGMLGSTAFSVAASDITLAELADVLERLMPGDVDDWVERFGRLPSSVDPDVRTCQQQPVFNVTSP